MEADIQEKEQKERQKQTNPSTGWKGQSQKSSQLKKLQLEGLKLPNLKLYYKRYQLRADNLTIQELLQAPTEGYEDAIVVPEIEAANIESSMGGNFLDKRPAGTDNQEKDEKQSQNDKTGLGMEKDCERQSQNRSRKQKFDETFYEAWDRFNDLLRGCPHHGFSELHQLDTFYNALNSIDQDSLNSAAGGNFLDKMPRECLKIIESKSKVRQSRNKAVVAKMSTSSSTPAVSSDVAELKDMVRALILDRKNQTPASAPVKAVEQSCVTCGGGHSYQNCPTTNSNIYHDNIQEYVSQAAAANFNQANSGYRPPMVSNQIRPPGFPPIQNPHANSQNNFNRGNNFNQNRGNNFNQGQIYRPPVNQPVAHQGPAPQTHGVSKTDFERYVTANDAVLRNMQNQGQNLQSQMANLTDMLSKFVTANTASTSGSGTLPGNTVTNPKEDLKGITTRSGVTIQGPKAVNHDAEVTKDTMPPANNGSTEDVQPPVVQIQSRNPNPEPNVAPVVAPVVTPIPKASIPFPSRRNDERRKEKANDQIEKFYEIFRDLSFEISFTDALMLMPKFASTLKTLIGNKEKLSELARTPLNENCSAVILNKLPKKLGDPGRFLIPCEFTGITTCNALADLELADVQSLNQLAIAKDVSNGCGKFHFQLIRLLLFLNRPRKVDDKLPVIIAKDLKDGKGKHSEGHICYVKKALEYTDHSAIKVSFCHEKMLRPRLHAVESCCSQEFVYENSRQNIGAENLAAVICILEERWEKHRCLGQDKLEMLYGPFRTALQNTNRRGDHQESSMNELNELRDQARELSDLIKRKPMRITMLDQKKPRFNVGDRVLLFNSRLMIFSGKLKSRLSGPFTVCPVFPYGTVGELSQIPGPTF
ncbi:hypothetical protein Tco_1078572 [Tanacetum coccineum]|uniref:Reverse transcriptase domain-containing protein n=1 Tax=Tanacetum coccineum TaxID=301880 RepID=A0ABQ5HQZ8_9ASTR